MNDSDLSTLELWALGAVARSGQIILAIGTEGGVFGVAPPPKAPGAISADSIATALFIPVEVIDRLERRGLLSGSEDVKGKVTWELTVDGATAYGLASARREARPSGIAPATTHETIPGR